MGLREGPRRPQWRGLAKQGGATAPTRAVPSCSGSRAGANLRGPGLPYVTTLTSHKEPSPGRLEEPLPRENPCTKERTRPVCYITRTSMP